MMFSLHALHPCSPVLMEGSSFCSPTCTLASHVLFHNYRLVASSLLIFGPHFGLQTVKRGFLLCIPAALVEHRSFLVLFNSTPK